MNFHLTLGISAIKVYINRCHRQHMAWIIDFRQVYTSLDSRPIKIWPGTYCRGDSAHALQITHNMGNRTTKVKRYGH